MGLWKKPDFKSSITGLLGRPATPSESILENGLEDIRESMLDALGECQCGDGNMIQFDARLRAGFSKRINGF